MKKKKFSKDRVSNVNGESNSQGKFSKRSLSLIFVGGIVLLMIISIFALNLGTDDTTTNNIEYKGINFVNRQGFWEADINGVHYSFEYRPLDVEMVKSVDLTRVELGNKVYLVFNPEEFSENSIELLRLRSFLTTSGILTSFACIKEEGCGDIPIVDCSNINKQVYLKNGNKTEIYNENSCIVLEALPGEEAIIINRFMYGLLGVI